ncbi:hypothetical protein V1519DRAFT_456578, partial [Lipomyces tetrasporus]
MNILKNTRGYFNGLGMKDWTDFLRDSQALIRSGNEEDYQRRLANMQVAYPKTAMGYFQKQWLNDEMKVFWLHMYTKDNVNFGISTTSIVESLHAMVKRALSSSTASLGVASKKMIQYERIGQAFKDVMTERNALHVNVTFTSAMELRPLYGYVTNSVLRKIL